MKRQTVMALAAAALIGTTSGVVFAVSGDGSSAGKEEGSATASPTAFGAGVAPDNNPLLYVADKTIHDGPIRIGITDITGLDVTSVDRLAGGDYLVGTTGYTGPDTRYLHIVDSAGRIRHLTRTTGSYDVNLAKDRIVATRHASKRVTVWSRAGKVVGATEDAVRKSSTASVGFVEDQVALISQGSKPKSILWNPDTSETGEIKTPQLESVGVSPSGSYMAGDTVKRESGSGCLGVATDDRMDTPHRWSACNWRSFGVRAQFSPDGSKILAIPARTDGFGPGELAAFVVRDGGLRPAGEFETPKLTTDAVWADDTHLWLTGARGGDTDFGKGAWIKKCDLDGGARPQSKPRRVA